MAAVDSVVCWTPYLNEDWTLIVAASPQGLCYVGLPGTGRSDLETFLQKHFAGWAWEQEADRLRDVTLQLDEYFSGSRRHFELDLDFRGTPFQVAVWQALGEIPYGETWTYRAVAQAVGRPKAVRAVGAANGQNPIPIVVPCHRVIGSNGTLTGYRGGLGLKQRLLRLEGLDLPSSEEQARFGL
jgi:methylated-DNA-[protein]-cysteine S-methyltransferase